LRREKNVNIGKIAENEVNFVVSEKDVLTCYQVSMSVLGKNIPQHEPGPFKKIPDNYPKVLLSLDNTGAGENHDEILHINLLDWQSNREQA